MPVLSPPRPCVLACWWDDINPNLAVRDRAAHLNGSIFWCIGIGTHKSQPTLNVTRCILEPEQEVNWREERNWLRYCLWPFRCGISTQISESPPSLEHWIDVLIALQMVTVCLYQSSEGLQTLFILSNDESLQIKLHSKHQAAVTCHNLYQVLQ